MQPRARAPVAGRPDRRTAITDQQDDAQKPGDARHETARTLAERALEHYAEGYKKTGDDLTDQAANMDRSAVVEVIEELDEGGKPAG